MQRGRLAGRQAQIGLKASAVGKRFRVHRQAARRFDDANRHGVGQKASRLRAHGGRADGDRRQLAVFVHARHGLVVRRPRDHAARALVHPVGKPHAVALAHDSLALGERKLGRRGMHLQRKRRLHAICDRGRDRRAAHRLGGDFAGFPVHGKDFGMVGDIRHPPRAVLKRARQPRAVAHAQRSAGEAQRKRVGEGLHLDRRVHGHAAHAGAHDRQPRLQTGDVAAPVHAGRGIVAHDFERRGQVGAVHIHARLLARGDFGVVGNQQKPLGPRQHGGVTAGVFAVGRNGVQIGLALAKRRDGRAVRPQRHVRVHAHHGVFPAAAHAPRGYGHRAAGVERDRAVRLNGGRARQHLDDAVRVIPAGGLRANHGGARLHSRHHAALVHARHVPVAAGERNGLAIAAVQRRFQ